MKRLVLLLFYLSGAFGLVYEVVWTRLLLHVFGTTALAVGTVLAAFMSGLALGSWLIGKAADGSPNPLLLYARLEVAVGAAALVAHFLLTRIEPVYTGLYHLLGRSDAVLSTSRFLIAFVLVMVPTMMMGATLPVLTRFSVLNLSGLGAGLSTLYAINTLGAVSGSLLTGFALIGSLGLHGAVLVAVAGNLGVGALAWMMAARAASPAVAPEDETGRRGARHDEDRGGPGPLTVKVLIWSLALSGFTSFAYEIYWTRSLVFLLGNSTYAVTTMLASFLTGIALGGWLIRFAVDRVRDRAALFGWIQILIGVASATALPILFSVVDFASVRISLGAASGEASRLFFSRFGIAALVMLLPATLIGATFPLVGRAGVSDPKRTGSAIGRIYAVNTLGNVLGALVPGLFLLSWLGIQKGILAMAALNVLAGAVVLLTRLRERPALAWALPVALVLAAVALTRAPLEFRFPSESQEAWHRVLYYREGPSATTTVMLEPDTRERAMSVDGIDIGGNGFTDFKQQLLAHLPKILLDDVSRELSIGFGSGILAGESLRHGRVSSITCVEIEPGVVEGAAHFSRENHGILQDPRLRIVVDDISSHLRKTEERYDVISADEKTSQEYASNGFSYSLEYYSMLRDRLAEGGIVAQWVPTTLPQRQYRMILRTFTSAFPHAQLWYFAPAYQKSTVNTLLVGSVQEVPLDPDRMESRLRSGARSFAGLARYGLGTAEAVLPHFVAGGEAIRKAVGDAHWNTLIHPRYEFYSPREFAASRLERLAAALSLIAEIRRSAVAGGSHPASENGGAPGLAAAQQAEAAFIDAERTALSGQPEAGMIRSFEEVLALAPGSPSLKARIGLRFTQTAYLHSDRGDMAGASRILSRAMAIDGRNAMHRVNYGLILGNLGRTPEALSELRGAVLLDPQLIAARRVLSQVLMQAGRAGEAIPHLQAILGIEPEDAQAKELLSRL